MTEHLLLAPYFVGQIFRHDPQDNYLYLNNAKAGCSSIKLSLFLRHLDNEGRPPPKEIRGDMIHGSGFWTRNFVQAIESRPFTFSVVRNPFARALSSYQTKIARNNFRLFPRFCQRYRLPASRKPSFIDFLRCLDRDDETVMDQHWRPQVQNLFVGSLPIDMVLRLETLSQNTPALESRIGFEFKGGVRNQREPSAKTPLAELFTPEAEDIVRRVYRMDFDAFGYSDRLSDVGDVSAEPMAFLDCGAAEANALKACAHLHAYDAAAALELLEAGDRQDVVHALLLDDARLTRETLAAVENRLRETHAESGSRSPVANHLAANLETRIAHLKGDKKEISRALARLGKYATFTPLPEQYRGDVSREDGRPRRRR